MSFIAWVMDRVMAHMKTPVDKDGNHDYVKERENKAKRVKEKIPNDLILTRINDDGVDGEFITFKEGRNNGTVFYIHGGGFTTGSASEVRDVAFYIAQKYRYQVFMPNYRLSPENKWPAHLEDVHEAYRYTLRNLCGHKNIILMGESAGGTLVLSLALYLKDRREHLPKAIVSFSPGTNNAEHYPSHTKNIKSDKMLKDMISKGIMEPLFDHQPTKEELSNYYLSVIYGDYKGLPPIFIAVSSSETLYDDSVFLYEKLKKENHYVMIDIKHHVCHAYTLFPFLREAKDTYKKCFEFISKIEN